MKTRTILASCVMAGTLVLCAAPALAQRYEVHMSVLPTGDGHVSGTIRPSLANYNQIKGAFPNPYPLLRDLTRSDWATQNATISYHDAKHQLRFAMDIRGLAVDQGDHWEIRGLGASISKVSAHGRELVLAVHDKNDDQDLIVTLVFPPGARDISVDPERSVVLYRFHPKLPDQPVTAGWGLVLFGTLLMVAGAFAPVVTRLGDRSAPASQAPVPPATVTTAPQGQAQPSFCNSCGSRLPEGDVRFCPHCGTPVGG